MEKIIKSKGPAKASHLLFISSQGSVIDEGFVLDFCIQFFINCGSVCPRKDDA